MSVSHVVTRKLEPLQAVGEGLAGQQQNCRWKEPVHAQIHSVLPPVEDGCGKGMYVSVPFQTGTISNLVLVAGPRLVSTVKQLTIR